MGLWPFSAIKSTQEYPRSNSRPHSHSHSRSGPRSHLHSHSQCTPDDQIVNVIHHENGDLELTYKPPGPSLDIPQHIIDGLFLGAEGGEKAEDYSWSGGYGTLKRGYNGGYRPRDSSGPRWGHSQSHHGSRHGSRASSGARTEISDMGLSGIHNHRGRRPGRLPSIRASSQARGEKPFRLSGTRESGGIKLLEGLKTIPEGGGDIGSHSGRHRGSGSVVPSAHGNRKSRHTVRSERSKQ